MTILICCSHGYTMKVKIDDKAINAVNAANNIKQRPNNYLLLAFTHLHEKTGVSP